MTRTAIILHHTASPDLAGLDTTGIRNFHMDERGYRDIGYHFAVEEIGVEYEVLIGRPMHLPAAASPGWNSSAFHVALIGNYETQEVPKEMLEVLEQRLLIPLCVEFKIDPIRIWGHKDVRSTLCPGTNLYRLLPEIRQRVALEV